MRIIDTNKKNNRGFKFSKEHKILEKGHTSQLIIHIPTKLKKDFKAKLATEGKTIREVIIKLIMGYLLR